MHTINNVHQQFAEFFKSEKLKPFAYLVSKKLSEGHICIGLNEAEEELIADPFFGSSSAITQGNQLLNNPFVTTATGIKQPFVLHNQKLYIQRYFNYESIILKRINAFLASEQKNLEEHKQFLQKHKDLIKQLFENKSSKETQVNWQLVAAINAVLNNFTIITGGPGTGKTTTVAKILALLFTLNPALKVALAAPTGKAAARVAESLKGAKIAVDKSIQEKFQSLDPATLHRLLKADPNSTKVTYNKDNPLDFDVVIVDESSMIDVSLFAKLLDAIADHTKLILLGDKDQLASVEAGSLFGDLCNAQEKLNLFSDERAAFINSFIKDEKAQIGDEAISEDTHPLFQHIVELRYSHRFVGEQGIGRFSKAVITNDEATIVQFIETEDKEVTIDPEYDDKVFSAFVKGYEDYIEEPGIQKAINKFNQLRVLCATREGDHGLYETNRRIENLLQQKKLIEKNLEFYEHRPIMITRNYYDLKLFNGDIGIIRKDDAGVLKAWFIDSENNLRSILPGFVASSETVFAMTIHKSQGSEFEKVLVMLPDQADIAILTRELLYTGVTRAKKHVIIQGTREVILATAERKVKRASGIKERFEEGDLVDS